MLYLERTAELQQDENLGCSGIMGVDPVALPWAVLALDADIKAGEAGWRLFGAYRTATAALGAAPAGERIVMLGAYRPVQLPEAAD
ncbi:MAG TPA: hypothetical protein VMC10_14315 [Stellaceae bacterium]|nr:hypothetical protein [Stellaceae bacterium]